MVRQLAAVGDELRRAHADRAAARIGRQHLVEQRDVLLQAFDRLARFRQRAGHALALGARGSGLGGRLVERDRQAAALSRASSSSWPCNCCDSSGLRRAGRYSCCA